MPEKNTQDTSSQRPRCIECERPVSVCLCSILKRVDNLTEILVLQHTSEKKHALNTVSLMKKCFSRITVLIGEDFTQNAVLLNFMATKKALLLYPSESSGILSNEEKKQHFNAFIVIDGTWKKAFKIFSLTSPLSTLPAFKLQGEFKGNYRIRKAIRPGSLSTLEASVAALNIIESDLPTDSVIEAFTKMIDLQIEKMGPLTYQENYLKNKD